MGRGCPEECAQNGEASHVQGGEQGVWVSSEPWQEEEQPGQEVKRRGSWEGLGDVGV